MKKIFTFIFAVLICICPLLFTACGKNEQPIDASVYFKEDVSYTIYSKGSEQIKDKLSTFTDNKFDNATQYMSITFEGKSDWLYKMTIDKICFDVYSNQNEELEFRINFSNLRNTDKKDGEDKFVVTVSAIKGKTVSVTVPIKDYIESNQNPTKVSISLQDSSNYVNEKNENSGLKIDISNVRFYGKHDLSKIGK